MTGSHEHDVLVPDVVGLVVDDARSVAGAVDVVLAQPDPDGPPLAALTWRLPVTVMSQDPPPGDVGPSLRVGRGRRGRRALSGRATWVARPRVQPALSSRRG